MTWLLLMLLQAGALADTVPDAELALQRGGLRLPNGLDVAVTVQTQTAVNGGVVLQTVYRLDEGSPTLTILAPPAGTPAPSGDRAGAGTTPAVTSAPTVSFDRAGGIRVTPGYAGPAVALSAGGGRAGDAGTAGLVQVGVGAITDAGTITDTSANGVRSVGVAGADLAITHLTGNAFGSAIANSGSDRTIDTVTSISIDLGNVSPDVLGSAMFRVQDIALDAVALRVGG